MATSFLIVTVWFLFQSFAQGQDSECNSYTTINDPTRDVTSKENYKCDHKLAKKWYRFKTAGSSIMPETCVDEKYCSAQHPGWLSGQHPDVSQGIVTRKVCYKAMGNCCFWNNDIRVRNCGSFFVYELQPTWSCYLRYCTTVNKNENECSSGTHNCHAQAICQDTSGGFTCTCKSGYTGNGTICTAAPEWKTVEAISLGKLPNIPQTMTYSIPMNVPSDATDVLLFVRVHSKFNPGHDTEGLFKIFTKEGQYKFTKYMAVFLYKGLHTTSNSQNLWLPVTKDRTVTVQYTGPAASNHLFGDIDVIGYMH